MFYSLVLERESHHIKWGLLAGNNKGAGSTKQLGTGEGEREDPWASAFVVSQGGVQNREQERISLLYCNVTISQLGEGKKGNLRQRQSYHTGAPGHLGRCSHPLSGDVETAGKYNFFTFKFNLINI